MFQKRLEKWIFFLEKQMFNIKHRESHKTFNVWFEINHKSYITQNITGVRKSRIWNYLTKIKNTSDVVYIVINANT